LGFLLAAAGSALMVVSTRSLPALHKTLERFHLANHEEHVTVLPFDIAGNNTEASKLADGLGDSLAGRL
jgi:TolB-like protein